MFALLVSAETDHLYSQDICLLWPLFYVFSSKDYTYADTRPNIICKLKTSLCLIFHLYLMAVCIKVRYQ